MKKVLLLLFAAFIHLSCYAQALVDSVLVNTHYRTFHFNKPLAKREGASLVFMLHGSGGSGANLIGRKSSLEEIASEENILLVYPDGYKRFWNECRKMATSQANIEDIDEGRFFDQMIEYFSVNFGISTDRVFAIGFSGGGHMAYKLALTMPAKFKAITAIVANLPDESNMDCVESGVPIPVMIVNGTRDPINPYEGGEVKISSAILGTVRSTYETFRYWAALSGYTGEPTEQNLPDKDTGDGKTLVKYTYQSQGKPEVVLLKVINGVHDYPGDIDVLLEAWEFFKRQMALENHRH